jgi:hypothetical protein
MSTSLSLTPRNTACQVFSAKILSYQLFGGVCNSHAVFLRKGQNVSFRPENLKSLAERHLNHHRLTQRPPDWHELARVHQSMRGNQNDKVPHGREHRTKVLRARLVEIGVT